MNIYKRFVLSSMAIALILCIASCIKSKEVVKVGYHYITNTSGKRIIHEVICNPKYVDKDTLRFFSSGETYQAELEWVISVRFPNYREKVKIYYLHTYIYSIDDTTSVRWEALWGVVPSAKTHCNQYFCLADKVEITENEIIQIREHYLTVNDSLLLTMQKDYAMLDKFKAYYEQK